MTTRYAKGCVFTQNGVIYVRFREGKAIRLGTKKEVPTKGDLERVLAPLREAANREDAQVAFKTVGDVIGRYRNDSSMFPQRASTAAVYTSWIDNHIIPEYGKTPLSRFGHPPELVQSWLDATMLSTKSKREIRLILNQIVRAAIKFGWLSDPPNLSVISLKRRKGETVRKARVLPMDELHLMLSKLAAPYNTMAFIAYAHGLRVSELFGLKWQDIDWLGQSLEIRTSVVNQIADVTKTPASEAIQPLDDAEIQMLKAWRQASEFTKATDYVFASPFKAGQLPYSYTGFKQVLWAACKAAKIKPITPHSFRHSLRAWLKANGVSAELQTEMMRHSKFDQSRQYGAHDKTVTPAVRELHSRLVREAIR